MYWIKEVFVDVVVSVFIIVAVLLEFPWMRWIITGYTLLLLLAKIIVLVGDSTLQLIRKTKTNAPDWFSHLLYALNTVVLLYAQWWYLAGAWILIWLLSLRAQQKLKARTGAA